MGKRLITKKLPLTRDQQTIPHYFNNYIKQKRKRGRPRKNPKEDDESYILPSKTDDTVDFDSLDLEDESIESQLNSPIIDLTEEEKPKETTPKKYPKVRTLKSVKKAEKKLKNSKIKRKRMVRKKGENMNSFAELNHCYNKLTDLIGEYNFSDIADVTLKLNNDIEKDKTDSTEITLFQELKKINNIIKKKEDIIMMCLSILASKKDKKENSSKVNKDNNDSPKFKEEKPLNLFTNEKKEIKEKSFINSFKEIKSSNYKLGPHFYNAKNGVFIYDPRDKDNQQSVTMYCKKKSLGCKAKCVIYKNSNDVTMRESHNHPGFSYNHFCKIHPEFKNKDWEHVQVIKEKGEEINIIQC